MVASSAVESPDQILIRHRDRMLMSAITGADYDAVLARHPSAGVEWHAAWAAIAERHLGQAAEADAAGHRLTAAQLRARTAASLHWAQFLLYEDLDLKASVLGRQSEVFAAAAADLAPRVEQLTVGAATGRQVAWLVRPEGAGPFPVLILLPGLDSTKEELYGWAGPLLARGWAVVVVDSPGVGALSEVPMTRASVSGIVSGVVDALSGDPRVRADRIAVAGASLGGLMAILALAAEPRLAAGACIGAAFDTAPRVPRLNASGQRGFLHVTQAGTVAALSDAVQNWSVEGLGKRVTAPMLVVHSDDDPVIGIEHAARYADEFGHAHRRTVHGAGQSCYGEGMQVLADLGDWLNDMVSTARVEAAAASGTGS
jgi:pimeloyl-ACP methyl ester carboxylesterase